MPTIADLLKPLGYTTGQFGKNHFGDRDEHLPTAHGFDEFFGNLYHLNAEEEPEGYYYPKDVNFRKKYGPRAVIHSWANGHGKQKIEDTGSLTRKRMETIDDEIFEAASKFIDKAAKGDKPFFCWFNTTRMHVWTHLKKESDGKTGIGLYPDGMVEHDGHVGQMLKKLDDVGIADNTIVMYSTDNGDRPRKCRMTEQPRRLTSQGEVLYEQANFPAALAAYQASLSIRERVAKADPGNSGWQRELAWTH